MVEQCGGMFRHDGIWKNGRSCGKGTTYYNDGAIQTGMYRPGYKRFGLGQDKYSNGQSYVGNFNNQKKNGHGIYYFANNQYYQGQWKDDLQHGKGIQYLQDGSRWEGTWVQDQKHGEFMYICKMGKIRQIWSQGKLVSECFVVDQ